MMCHHIMQIHIPSKMDNTHSHPIAIAYATLPGDLFIWEILVHLPVK